MEGGYVAGNNFTSSSEGYSYRMGGGSMQRTAFGLLEVGSYLVRGPQAFSSGYSARMQVEMMLF